MNNDSYGIKYFLPEVVAKGLIFKIIPNARGKDFELYQNSDDLAMRGDYMIGQMQHKPVFRLGLNKEKNDINGFINTQQLRSGIMHITCLLYTSDAADERSSVDLGGSRIIKKKKLGQRDSR